MEIIFTDNQSTHINSIIIPISGKLELTARIKEIDEQSGGVISAAVDKKIFNGEFKSVLPIMSNGKYGFYKIVLIGCGNLEELTYSDYLDLGGIAYKNCEADKLESTSIIVDGLKNSKFAQSQIATIMACGFELRSYGFNKYKTKNNNKQNKLKLVEIVTWHFSESNKFFETMKPVLNAVTTTRNLISEPSNKLYPEEYANRCKDLSKHGLEVEILDEKKMEKLGMDALLGVAKGSAKPPRLVVLKWNGFDKSSAPVALVGKGVTFDTGGISLKPSKNMDAMKYDMGGSAVVVGVMQSLAERKAKVNAVGIIALVENMPDGNAQKPGDVVTSMSGQTIEVLNTDAEGRLILADALWYTQQNYNPKIIIDLATLTGAISVALGSLHAGLFSNNDELANNLLNASKEVGEGLWRLPISPVGSGYDKWIDSKVADVQNISNNEGGAGSITAAQFLQRFVNNKPWAHLDIAGVTWTNTDLDTSAIGATGYGVRLLDQLIKHNYEVI